MTIYNKEISENNHEDILASILQKYAIKAFNEDEEVFVIKPLWIEAYYDYKDGNTCGACDKHICKETDYALFFRSFSRTYKRNRVDICIGEKGIMYSILIKKAKIIKMSDKYSDVFLGYQIGDIIMGSSIANTILTAGNIPYAKNAKEKHYSNKLKYELISCPCDFDISDCETRIGLNKEGKDAKLSRHDVQFKASKDYKRII